MKKAKPESKRHKEVRESLIKRMMQDSKKILARYGVK